MTLCTLGRTTVLVFSSLLGAAHAGASAPADHRFQVLLDGKPIGHHRFSFSPLEEGGGYRLVSEAEYAVKFLFIEAYSYDHRSEEVWRDGCLRRIDARTDDNGDDYRISGEWSDDGLELAVNGQSRQVDKSCVRTFAYWQPRLLDAGELLNSQTGELDPVTTRDLGRAALPWQPDREASTLELDTERGIIQLWYDSEGRWLGLRSRLENDRVLEYRPAGAGGEEA